MKVLVALSFIGLAFPLGLVVPDVDQKIPFLVHLSIFTHAPWLALLATMWALKSKSHWAVPCICAAFTCGLVLHFAAELFPKAWMGFADPHSGLWQAFPDPVFAGCCRLWPFQWRALV